MVGCENLQPVGEPGEWEFLALTLQDEVEGRFWLLGEGHISGHFARPHEGQDKNAKGAKRAIWDYTV